MRIQGLVWLLISLTAALTIIGRSKGLRALMALFVSALIIAKLIVPLILQGRDPILVAIFGGALILLVIVYITEGFTTVAHIAVTSITIGSAITILLSWFFTRLTQLTGLMSEEEGYINGYGTHVIAYV